MGDCNCDGSTDFRDVNPFVAALAGSQPCSFETCDINQDGFVNFDDINPFVAILSSGGGPGGGVPGVWLGAGTTCDQCCWVRRASGCRSEGERLCSTANYDINGGCDSVPPVFEPLACGETICGRSGTTYGGVNDTDWYTWTIDAPASLRVTLQAAFTADLWIMQAGHGPSRCDPNDPNGYVVLAYGRATECQPLELTIASVPPDEYWIDVAAVGFAGDLCIANYNLTLSCEAAMFADTIPPPPLSAGIPLPTDAQPRAQSTDGFRRLLCVPGSQ